MSAETVAHLQGLLDGTYQVRRHKPGPAPRQPVKRWVEPEPMKSWVQRQRQELQWQAYRQRQNWERLVEKERRKRWNKAAKPTQLQEVYEDMANEYFERFVDRMMPAELREGAPVPPTWKGTTQDWNSLRQQAEDVEREKLAAEFAEGIALRGLTPEEMATGELQDGSEIYALTGKVKRPPKATLPPELEVAAAELLRGLEARHITLDGEQGIQQYKLRQVAYRRWQGEPGPVELVLQEAQAVILAHDSQQQGARQEANAMPVLTVHWPFRGPGGVQYVKGEQAITPEQAGQLTEWAQTIQAQAKARSLTSIGFPQWPLFTLTGQTNGQGSPSAAKASLANDPQALPL